MRVFAGSIAGATSIAPYYSEIAGADLDIHARSELELPLESTFEHAVLVLEGDCALEGQTLEIIKREMRETTGDLLERRIAQSLAPALGVRADAAVAQDDQSVLAWRRIVVADGIELHVRDDSPAARDDALVAMREAVRAALGRADIRG